MWSLQTRNSQSSLGNQSKTRANQRQQEARDVGFTAVAGGAQDQVCSVTGSVTPSPQPCGEALLNTQESITEWGSGHTEPLEEGRHKLDRQLAEAAK